MKVNKGCLSSRNAYNLANIGFLWNKWNFLRSIPILNRLIMGLNAYLDVLRVNFHKKTYQYINKLCYHVLSFHKEKRESITT